VETVRATVPAGDYSVSAPDGSVLAAVERKSLDNLAATLSDGTLAFQLQRLAELPLAAVVVEARYLALHKLERVNGNWLADQLARLEVRYPEVHLVFADSRPTPKTGPTVSSPSPHHRTRRRDRPRPERRLRQPSPPGASSRTPSQRIGIFDPYRLWSSPTERIKLAASSRLSLPPTPVDARYGMSHRESPNQTSCADTTRADIRQGHHAHASQQLRRPPPRS